MNFRFGRLSASGLGTIFDFRFQRTIQRLFSTDGGTFAQSRLMSGTRAQSKVENRKSKFPPGFTLLEIIVALALVGLVLVGMNTFVFSMTELWGKNADLRLFDQHVRAVTRFLDEQLRSASLPPAASAGTDPITAQEIHTKMGPTDNLLTFELSEGCRLFTWPDRPLPEVVCSLQLRDREGLKILWHSRLEKRFNDDPPRETLVSPLVTGLSYDYYDENFRNWKNETQIRRNNGNQLEVPQRIRLKFTYKKMTRETVITLPSTSQGLPNF
jgi:prepilin-type N-terminal cleavage/methylation domain-containing protein